MFLFRFGLFFCLQVFRNIVGVFDDLDWAYLRSDSCLLKLHLCRNFAIMNFLLVCKRTVEHSRVKFIYIQMMKRIGNIFEMCVK